MNEAVKMTSHTNGNQLEKLGRETLLDPCSVSEKKLLRSPLPFKVSQILGRLSHGSGRRSSDAISHTYPWITQLPQDGRRRRSGVIGVRGLDGRGDGEREHGEGAGEAGGGILFHELASLSLRGSVFRGAKLEVTEDDLNSRLKS